MGIYKSATAYTRTFFLVQSVDHLSALTGASPTVTLSKAGAAFGAAAGAVAEIGSGWYKVSLTTADTGTLGDLSFHVTAASADDTDFVDQIVAVDLQDAVAFGLSRIDATISSRSTYAGGAVASVTAAVTVGTNNDKTGYTLSAAGVQAIWDALTSALTTAGSIGKLLVDNINATISSRMATFTLPTNFSSLSITAAGLVDITQTAADKVWSTTTRALTDKVGFALSAAGVQAIWDALTSALTTVGSIGKLLVDNINATISSRGTGTALTAVQVENAVWDAVRASHTTAGTFGQGAASVQGNVTGSVASVTGSVGSIAAGGIVTSSFGVGAIDSVAFAQGAADRVLASVVEGTVTLKQSQQLANAANAGIVAGAATTSVTIKGMDDTTTRVSATCDADGNRTAVTRTYS